MSGLPLTCVVDASVGIKLFVAEELSETVREFVFERLADPKALIHVPDLFYIECANILWKKALRSEFPQCYALESIADLKHLGVQATPTTELVERALEMALEFNISAYDACYSALAETMDVPLVTFDMRLLRALACSKCAVVTLSG